MLDTIFRSSTDRKQLDIELRDLINEVREEREALRTERDEFRAQVERASGAMAKLSSTNKALDELNARADAVIRKVNGLAEVASSFDERARRMEKLEQRVGQLVSQVVVAENAARELQAPEGHLAQHRKALDRLGQKATETQATMDAMRRENEQLAQEHGQLQQSANSVRQAVQGLAAFEGKLGELVAAEATLRLEVTGTRDIALGARQDAESAASTVKEVASRFASLMQLPELSKDTEKRISSLHALAEHVSQKVATLETQKHAVDHAAAETARLNQMVWSMEAQLAKLTEGQQKMRQTEEAVGQIWQMARSVTQDLASATASREEFLRESARVDGHSRSLLDSLRAMLERLGLEKSEYSAFDDRLKTLSTDLAGAETRMQAVLSKDEQLTVMLHKAEGLGKMFSELRVETEELAQRQITLGQLGEQLGTMEAQCRRMATQQDSLMRSQSELDTLRADVEGLRKSYAESARLRDTLGKDRTALEAFVERTAGMIGRTPEIESRLDTLLGRMGQLEQGTAAAERLGAATLVLQEGLERVGQRMGFVDSVGERVHALFAMSNDVECKLAQLAERRREAEDLAQQCMGLGTQIALAHQQLAELSTQQGRLLPLAAQIEGMEQDLQHAKAAMAASKNDEAQAQAQHAQLMSLLEQGAQQVAQTGEQMRQLRELGHSLSHVGGRSEAVLAELAQVKARQADALAQVSLTEDQLQRAEAMVRLIEQRRVTLAHTEKALAGFESRVVELDRMTEALDKRMQWLAERESVVQAVKAEVDGIRQLANRSKDDLQFVSEHRQQLGALRGEVDGLLSRIGETDGKIVLIESWRKKVDEVQVQATAVDQLLGEVQGTLESLSEQRAVIDDVGEKLARLDFTVQEAKGTMLRLDASAQDSQNTLRTLQREREVAERVATSIKLLRARGALPTA